MNLHPPKQTTPSPGPGRKIIRGVLFLSLLFAATCLHAQGPAPSPSALPADPAYVVAHVDVVPTFADAALTLLKAYAATCHKAPGARRFEVLREAGRPNHFTLVEVWESEAARQANEAAEATRRFREQLHPMLGSPFDERLQQLAQP